jgi:DNA-binding NtrC family response regulator
MLRNINRLSSVTSYLPGNLGGENKAEVQMDKQLLLIEDDPGTQLLLKQMILKIDPEAHVDCVESAEKAYRILNDVGVNRPGYDLVMCDLNLSGVSGLSLWDVCLKKYAGTEFVFFSGISYEKWCAQIKKHRNPPPPFIPKPIDEECLRRFWENWFSISGTAAS